MQQLVNGVIRNIAFFEVYGQFDYVREKAQRLGHFEDPAVTEKFVIREIQEQAFYVSSVGELREAVTEEDYLLVTNA